MRIRFLLFFLIGSLILLTVTGCSVASAFSPTETSTPLPTNTPLPTITPTATDIPYYLDATIWSGELQVPILIYHRFVADYKNTDATQMRYSDFMNQIQTLYDNGFRLISMEDWLNGTFNLPAGTKPLILTLDDLWFADQLYIEEDGNPSVYSGLGLLWKFSQEHPDFGYSVTVFSNMGDKYYADLHDKDYFIVSEGDDWKLKLGQTIAWAMDHGIQPYNHLYKHPQLSLMSNVSDIKWQIEMNDFETRDLLTLAGREDLIPQLGNMIALPFGEWPATTAGLELLKNYKTPEGKQVTAIFEAYNLGSQEFTPSIFSEDFNPFNIVRITASERMINWIVSNKDLIPSATVCKLGPLDENLAEDVEVIKNAIRTAITSQTCPEGIYNVTGSVFIAKDGQVSFFKSALSDEVLNNTLPTLTPTP